MWWAIVVAAQCACRQEQDGGDGDQEDNSRVNGSFLNGRLVEWYSKID